MAGIPTPSVDRGASRGRLGKRRIDLSVCVWLLIPILSLLFLGFLSRYSLLTVIFDALAAAVIFLPATLFGLALLRVFGLDGLAVRWRILFGAALGLGSLSILVFVAGCLGWFDRRLWVVALSLMSAAGLMTIGRKRTAESECRHADETAQSAGTRPLLWLAVVPFLTLALSAASHAPGFLWQEEGYGYDVLEYHLQLPKEYLSNGRISYLPHNVYANFPANVEMLYLLAFILDGDVRDAGTTANMIHLALAALMVAGTWAVGREFSPIAGIVAGVAAGTVGWLEYLSGLAYVENGLLFFGVCSVGAMFRGFASGPQFRMRWALLSGVCAGLACGCKYTGVAMIVLPLLPAAFVLPARWPERLRCGALFLGGGLLAFSPWLVKNGLWTGNPVFPLANVVFQAAPPGWSMEQTEQWNRGHSLSSSERNVAAHGRAIGRGIIGDVEQRFGPVLLGLGLVGLFLRRRDRIDGVLLLMVVAQVMVWIFFTHGFSRFAVPIVIPLAVLAGRAVIGDGIRRRVAVVVLLALGAGWNLAFAAKRHSREALAAAPASLIYEGKVPGYEYLAAVNSGLPGDAKVLVVGDAKAFYYETRMDYCVAFSRNPFFEMIHSLQDGPKMIEWLRQRGYTHVLVHWSEIRRLERTYGFSPPTTSEDIGDALRRLGPAGLTLVNSYPHPNPAEQRPYVELYLLPG